MLKVARSWNPLNARSATSFANCTLEVNLDTAEDIEAYPNDEEKFVRSYRINIAKRICNQGCADRVERRGFMATS